MKSFNDRVYDLCKRIPKGKVSSYGEIAKALDTKAFRAVGQALKKNPYAPIVPCHRVVRSDGNIGGFSGSDIKNIKKKIAILREEGVEVRDNKVIDFKEKLFFFDN
ncbi:MGMT family protein [archaeon]|jgi:methylated-DNA-[protein]-cysteine S-methyltransferase|nr:MGMT family protein [archaeon]